MFTKKDVKQLFLITFMMTGIVHLILWKFVAPQLLDVTEESRLAVFLSAFPVAIAFSYILAYTGQTFFTVKLTQEEMDIILAHPDEIRGHRKGTLKWKSPHCWGGGVFKSSTGYKIIWFNWEGGSVQFRAYKIFFPFFFYLEYRYFKTPRSYDVIQIQNIFLASQKLVAEVSEKYGRNYDINNPNVLFNLINDPNVPEEDKRVLESAYKEINGRRQ